MTLAGGDWSSTMCWTKGLEYVLQDRAALDAFREWLQNNDSSQPLDLHFAIRAYERMVSECHPKTADLAKQIHQTYISLRTGSCSFIPVKIRQELSGKVKSMNVGSDPKLFNSIRPYLAEFLRRQHQQFVTSDEFVDAFNRCTLGDDNASGVSRRVPSASMRTPLLTAEALLKSRQDREHTLGESAVERMYPGGVRQPYTCHATTSQNDSAVSSSFSSDANGSHSHRSQKLRVIQEEHLRGNPTVPNVIPRLENVRTDSQQFDHTTDEGRRYFADTVCKALKRVLLKELRDHKTKQQLRDIEQRKCTAREVITAAEPVDVDLVDDDDDVDRYVDRMREDSLKASANRSPLPLSPRPFSPDHRERSKSGGERSASANGFMSMSMTAAYPATSRGYSTAYPLPNAFNTATYYKDKYANRTSHMYDSSGIGSMVPSGYSGYSGFSDGSRHSRRSVGSGSMTTPRKPKRHSSSSNHPLLTISYKGSDGVPVVAHVPAAGGQIILRDFLKHFSFKPNDHAQFFFKTVCEDDSAPYQLELITDESAVLPLFQGRVTAELKYCDSQ